MIALARGPKDELNAIIWKITVKGTALWGIQSLGLRWWWKGTSTAEGSLAAFPIAAEVVEDLLKNMEVISLNSGGIPPAQSHSLSSLVPLKA